MNQVGTIQFKLPLTRLVTYFQQRKQKKARKKFYNFGICLSSFNKNTFPLAEMLALSVDTKNITCFLTNLLCDIQKINKTNAVKLLQIFETDYAWVNIHSILSVFLKRTISQYLEEKFFQFVNALQSEKSVLTIDKLHLIKFILENSRKNETENFKAETFVAVFLHLLKVCVMFLTIENG
jgi:hypothetical protein